MAPGFLINPPRLRLAAALASQRLLALGLFAAAALLAPSTGAAAELGRYALADDAGFDFTVESDPPLTLNKMTTLIVRIHAKDPTQPLAVTGLSFDARMPAHNHGMVVRPKVIEQGAGEFRIEGVKLHMAGDWQLSFRFKKGNAELAKSVPLQLSAP